MLVFDTQNGSVLVRQDTNKRDQNNYFRGEKATNQR